MIAVLVLAATAASSCVDPGADLRALALEHVAATRDGTLGDERMVEGLTRYLRSGTRTDQLTAVTRYTNLGTGRYSRRHLALGLIHATSPDITPAGTYGYRNRRLLLYSNTEDVAFRELESALERHPGDWIAAIAMTRIALGVRAPARLHQAREALSRLLESDPDNTTLRIALADVLIAQDSAELALVAMRGKSQECPAAAHVTAEALVLTGDSVGGGRAYLAALPKARHQLDRFLEDVMLTLPWNDRLAAERVPESERVQWLLDWWDRSAARSVRTVEERVAAHLARITHAQLHYRKAHNPQEPLQNASDRLLIEFAPPWDARGEVFIRHGAPDTTISTTSGILMYVPRNESWVYGRGDVNEVFHFNWHLGADWSLASPFIGCGGAGGPASFRAFDPSTSFSVPSNSAGAMFAADYYAARAPYDEYSDALRRHCERVWGGRSDPEIHNHIRRSQEAYDSLMVRTLRTESARHVLKERVRLRVNTYAFRDGSGTAEAVAVLWVPKSDIGGMPAGAAHVQAAVVGENGRALRRDTVLEFSRLGAQATPILALEMTWRGTLPQGARLYTLARDATDETRGAYDDSGIPARDGAARAISSLVIAAPGQGGPLRRGARSVWPHASHTVLLGETFRLFYEMYGVAADEPLATRITVAPVDAQRARSLLSLFRGRRSERIMEFEGVAEVDERNIAIQDVEIGGDLVPGEYAVTVEVRTASGTLTRTGRLVVRDPTSS